ncbi:MAG: hypothetical protein DRN31_01550, partial [Thermoplasmata archaeon]
MEKNVRTRTLVTVIIFLFLIDGMFSVTGSSENNSSGILYVGGSGPGNYTSIQSALDNASSGDTVFVYDDSSPYEECIVVDKSITIMGENRDTTAIDGNISINAKSV